MQLKAELNSGDSGNAMGDGGLMALPET